jgi:hypothetical protein
VIAFPSVVASSTADVYGVSTIYSKELEFGVVVGVGTCVGKFDILIY